MNLCLCIYEHADRKLIKARNGEPYEIGICPICKRHKFDIKKGR